MVEEVKTQPALKIPVAIELPKQEERQFFNKKEEKPVRKLATVDIKFGDLNDKNVEQFRILNYLNLPVVYSEDFYRRLTTYQRYSKLAYLKDVLVGAISCKEDIQEDKNRAVYIMTITVLKPYRRYGIGSKLLEKAIEDCAKNKDIKKLTLHMQKGNDSALEFYLKHGFEIVKVMEDYYTDLEEAGCYILEKKLD